MTYSEEKMNLFDVSDEYALAHCISADLKMGAGIAVEFNKRFDMRNKLIEAYGDKILWSYINNEISNNITGTAVKYENVINLITKERYWHKPTYHSIRCALQHAKCLCIQDSVHKIAMPKIGCGLDKLEWNKVREIIQEVFEHTSIEIKVCYL